MKLKIKFPIYLTQGIFWYKIKFCIMIHRFTVASKLFMQLFCIVFQQGSALKLISGNCLKNAIISGANNISRNRSHIDELNIFPVPDGDTGTNMSMTIRSAVDALLKIEDQRICETSKLIASSILRGARGNSGVILSLLFKGFAQGLKDIDKANGFDLVTSLGLGVEAAYNAVMKPTEGTMLTVARVAYERGKIAAHFNNETTHVWSEVCIGARETLATTPELLPVLKKAGVVDAGGKGLCLIFEGMLSVFKDGIIMDSEIKPLDVEGGDTFKNAAAEFDGDIRFTYCTEFIVGRIRTIKTPPQKLRKYLEGIGDCVVVVDDEDIIKVHVHTESPGKVLQEGLRFGQLLTVKVENMKEQHRLAVEAEREKSLKNDKHGEYAEPEEDIGFVSVAAGEGLKVLFTDLGCNNIISGGQTMNPSTDQILEAALATPAKTVYIFPNNKNIIMAAEQAAALADDRRVIVIPTKTIPQGISALLAYDPEHSEEENIENMKNASQKVRTGQITFASRNSEFGGFKIKEGDILALDNGKLILVENDPLKAVIKLIKSITDKSTEFITIIYGESISKEQAENIFEKVKSKVGPGTEVTLIEGQQPIYHFIVSVE